VRVDAPDVIEVQGPPTLTRPAEVVIAALSPVVTTERLQRIKQVVEARTDNLAVVLDRIADPHNASAVLRSAEAFGVQNVHAIVGEQSFLAARGVAKGTERWLDVARYQSALECARRLKAEGHEIYVAAMGGRASLDDLKRIPKLAVAFGNEHRGVSEDLREVADGTFSIPMRGFVESLNVSVAAAITMQTLTDGRRPGLDPTRRRELLARFLMNSVRNADRVIEQSIGND
jgi:tRNA (guanosine-2'-O-)-methyltransferase